MGSLPSQLQISEQSHKRTTGNSAYGNHTDPDQEDDSPDTLRAIGALERGLGGNYMDAHLLQGWISKRIQAVVPIAEALGAKIIGYKAGEKARQAGLDPERVGQSNGAHYGGYTFLNAETSAKFSANGAIGPRGSTLSTPLTDDEQALITIQGIARGEALGEDTLRVVGKE